MIRSVILIIFVVITAAKKATYENYKVYRIIPSSKEHLKVLNYLGNLNKNYTFWNEPSTLNRSVDLMISPGQETILTNLMDDMGMEHKLFIENVQRLINEENPKTRDTSFGWKKYHSLQEIYDWLESLPEKFPSKVKVINAGKTYQGRKIKGVKLSFGGKKAGVFIEGGIHAREWISPATVTYLINEFLTSKDQSVRKLAESYDWYMFPIFNPDGYVYTHVSKRLWRKTLSNLDKNGCGGADANRNWNYKWMHVGASNNPCRETYAGKSPFSEIETKTMSDYIKSIGHKLFAYISFHSYSQLLLFPYGHTAKHLDNYNELSDIGKETVRALKKVHGTRYSKPGNVVEVIYPASGGSMDWVKATLKLPITYTYELRDKGRYGFLLPANQIIPNSEEVLASLIAMFKEAEFYGYP